MQKAKKGNALALFGLVLALALGMLSVAPASAFADEPNNSKVPSEASAASYFGTIKYPVCIEGQGTEYINVYRGQSIKDAVDSQFAKDGYTIEVTWQNGNAISESETPNCGVNYHIHWVWIGCWTPYYTADKIIVSYELIQNNITFVMDGVDPVTVTTDIEKGYSVDAPDSVADATDGAHFSGIWKGSDGNTYTTEQIEAANWDHDMTFTALYNDLFNVAFFDGLNSDNPYVSQFQVNDGCAISHDGDVPQDPQREGYTFLGWDDSTGNLFSAEDVATYVITEDKTFTAVWKQDEVISVEPENPQDQNTGDQNENVAVGSDQNANNDSDSNDNQTTTTEEKAESLPQTADSALPLVAGTALLAGAAGLTAFGAYKKRKSL